MNGVKMLMDTDLFNTSSEEEEGEELNEEEVNESNRVETLESRKSTMNSRKSTREKGKGGIPYSYWELPGRGFETMEEKIAKARRKWVEEKERLERGEEVEEVEEEEEREVRGRRERRGFTNSRDRSSSLSSLSESSSPITTQLTTTKRRLSSVKVTVEIPAYNRKWRSLPISTTTTTALEVTEATLKETVTSIPVSQVSPSSTDSQILSKEVEVINRNIDFSLDPEELPLELNSVLTSSLSELTGQEVISSSSSLTSSCSSDCIDLTQQEVISLSSEQSTIELPPPKKLAKPVDFNSVVFTMVSPDATKQYSSVVASPPSSSASPRPLPMNNIQAFFVFNMLYSNFFSRVLLDSEYDLNCLEAATYQNGVTSIEELFDEITSIFKRYHRELRTEVTSKNCLYQHSVEFYDLIKSLKKESKSSTLASKNQLNIAIELLKTTNYRTSGTERNLYFIRLMDFDTNVKPYNLNYVHYQFHLPLLRWFKENLDPDSHDLLSEVSTLHQLSGQSFRLYIGHSRSLLVDCLADPHSRLLIQLSLGPSLTPSGSYLLLVQPIGPIHDLTPGTAAGFEKIPRAWVWVRILRATPDHHPLLRIVPFRPFLLGSLPEIKSQPKYDNLTTLYTRYLDPPSP